MGKSSTNDPTRPEDDGFWEQPTPLPYDTTIYGTAGDDVPLNGGYLADTIYGLGGNDRVHGFGGNDRVEAGSGNDVVYGGSGNDLLYGQQGTDQIDGGAGNDRIFGGADQDYLLGGAGADTFHFAPADQVSAADIILDFAVEDRISIQYGHGTIAGTAANYTEFELTNASFDQMKALADFVIAAPKFQHVFITNGTDAYLFSGHADTTETWIALWGLGSVNDFGWMNIV
jgi:Ca2+-binding RTX toxin-like protein